MSRTGLLDHTRSHLLVIDVQDKLLTTIHAVDAMIARARLVVAAARELHVPITLSEQYPKGLGSTQEALRQACGETAPVFAKTAFSCFRDEALRAHFESQHARKQLVIVGMEAHVCVLQTALDACDAGYDVFVARDAVSSRTAADAEAALHRMAHAGVTIISAEMAFFEWLERAGTPAFKALSPLLK